MTGLSEARIVGAIAIALDTLSAHAITSINIMRICVFTETALPLIGGQELVVDHLAREFLRLDYEVIVLAARPRSRIYLGDDKLPYKVVRHPRYISTYRLLRWYGRYVDRLRQWFPFDVLHCHSVQPTGYVAACCRNREGLRIVITSHSGELSPESSLLSKPGATERCKRSLRRADAVVAISDFVEQRLRALDPELETIVRIPNGVDASRFESLVKRADGISERIKPLQYFLFLGRIVERKGVDLLLRALERSMQQMDASAVIAGEGPAMESMQRLSRSLRVDHRVHFVGHVDGDDKTWLLQNAIATVMPSRMSEGFPLVLLESFASGRPVIATRIPGLRELVTHGVNGLLVEPDLPESLAAALIDIARSPIKANCLGSNARDFASHHDWPTIAGQYISLFNQLGMQ